MSTAELFLLPNCLELHGPVVGLCLCCQSVDFNSFNDCFPKNSKVEGNEMFLIKTARKDNEGQM